MKIALQYNEINELIKRETGYEIIVKHVSSDTLHVSYNISIPFIGKKEIGVDVQILGFKNSSLELKAATDLISKILSLIPSLDISKYATIDNEIISVQLNNIDELKKALSVVHPTNLCSSNEYLMLEGTLL